MGSAKLKYISADELRNFISFSLVCSGVGSRAAAIVADSLTEADLRGHSSHGVERLPAYISRLRAGLIKPNARPRTIVDADGLIIVDGDNGLGQVVAATGMRKAVTRAHKIGICAASIVNSNHFGSAAYFAEIAASHGCIGIAMSNGPATMALFDSKAPLVGTNPLAYAIPGAEGISLVADISSSAIARGRIIQANRLHRRIPKKTAIAKSGLPTTDPLSALEGAVLPFENHKGAVLAMLVELLCASFGKGRLSKDVGSLYGTDKPSGVGHFLLAISVSHVVRTTQFFEMSNAFTEHVRNASDTGKLRLPGERARKERAKRLSEGIPFAPSMIADIEVLAQTVGYDIEVATRPKISP